MDSSFFKTSDSHKSYMDILRVLCIILVVYNHTPAFHLPLNHPVGDNFILLLLSICDKVAVPIFFMISGALLLKKSESLPQLLKKRISRFILVIVLFAFVQYINSCLIKNVQPTFIGYISACVNPKRVAFSTIQGDIQFASLNSPVSWYLYAYLGLLLMLPMLRSMVKNMENSVYVYMGLLYVFMEVLLPSAIYLCGGYHFPKIYLADFVPLITGSYIKGCAYSVLFFIIGYYLEEKVDIRKVTGKFFCVSGFVALLFIVVDGLMTRHAGTHIKNLNASSIQLLPWFNGAVFPACVFIYLLMKKLVLLHPISDIFKWGLSKLGAAVFTVFFLENIFRKYYSETFFEYKYDYPVWFAFLTVSLTVLSGLILGLVFKQIPGLKKIL